MLIGLSGKVLALNPNSETREGDSSGIAIIIELESMEDTWKFYESDKYTEARIVRELAAETNLVLVEGLRRRSKVREMVQIYLGNI